MLNAKAWRCDGFEIHYRYNVSRTTAGLGVLTNPNAAISGGFGEWVRLPPSRRHRPDSFWVNHEPLFTADRDFGELKARRLKEGDGVKVEPVAWGLLPKRVELRIVGLEEVVSGFAVQVGEV